STQCYLHIQHLHHRHRLVLLLRIRRTSTSTLFPYTTLFRSLIEQDHRHIKVRKTRYQSINTAKNTLKGKIEENKDGELKANIDGDKAKVDYKDDKLIIDDMKFKKIE